MRHQCHTREGASDKRATSVGLQVFFSLVEGLATLFQRTVSSRIHFRSKATLRSNCRFVTFIVYIPPILPFLNLTLTLHLRSSQLAPTPTLNSTYSHNYFYHHV